MPLVTLVRRCDLCSVALSDAHPGGQEATTEIIARSYGIVSVRRYYDRTTRRVLRVCSTCEVGLLELSIRAIERDQLVRTRRGSNGR